MSGFFGNSAGYGGLTPSPYNYNQQQAPRSSTWSQQQRQVVHQLITTQPRLEGRKESGLPKDAEEEILRLALSQLLEPTYVAEHTRNADATKYPFLKDIHEKNLLVSTSMKESKIDYLTTAFTSTIRDTDNVQARLGRQLTAMGLSADPSFLSLTDKRTIILKCVYEAYEESFRQLKQKGYSRKTQTPSRPAFSDTAVYIMLSILEDGSANNHALTNKILAYISKQLKSLTPLELVDDAKLPMSEDAFDAMHSCLKKIAYSNATSESIRHQAVELLVGLAVSRGSLPYVLTVLKFLMFELQPTTSLNVQNLMISLKARPQSGQTDIPDPINRTMHVRMPYMTNYDCALATDGVYLYMHSVEGLSKIGTGEGGTLPGKIYAELKSYRSTEMSSLVCIGDCLYYRSPNIAPAEYIVLSCKYLTEIGAVHADGMGTVPSVDHSHLDLGLDYPISQDEPDPSRQTPESSQRPQHHRQGSEIPPPLHAPVPMTECPNIGAVNTNHVCNLYCANRDWANVPTAPRPAAGNHALVTDGRFLMTVVPSLPIEGSGSGSSEAKTEKQECEVTVYAFDPEASYELAHSVLLQRPAPKIHNTVLKFHMPGSCIKIGSPSHLSLNGEFTMELWLRPSLIAAQHGAQTLLNNGDVQWRTTLTYDSRHSQFAFHFVTPQGRDQTTIPCSNLINTNAAWNDPTASSLSQDWIHIAAVYDQHSGHQPQWFFYVNGNRSHSYRAKVLPHNISKWTIGASESNQPTHGAIAEVRLWKEARTQDQVNQLMNAKRDHFVDTVYDTLIGYWPLDEGMGLIAHDLSSYGHHGKLIAAKWSEDLRPNEMEIDKDRVATFPPTPCHFSTTVSNQTVMFTNGERLVIIYPKILVEEETSTRYQVFSLETGLLLEEALREVGIYSCSMTLGGESCWAIEPGNCFHYRMKAPSNPQSLWRTQRMKLAEEDPNAFPTTQKLIKKYPLPGEKPEEEEEDKKASDESGTEPTPQKDSPSPEDPEEPVPDPDCVFASTATMVILSRLEWECEQVENESLKISSPPPIPEPEDTSWPGQKKRKKKKSKKKLQQQQAAAPIAAASPVPPNLRHKSSPFAVNLCVETFESILTIIEELCEDFWKPSLDEYGKHQELRMYSFLAILRVLRTNIAHLVSWNADPLECGFERDTTTEDSAISDVPTMQNRYVQLLNRLIVESPTSRLAKSIADKVHDEVCECLSVGLEVFYTVAGRARILSDLVVESRQLQGTERANPLREMLMSRYFRILSQPSNVISLVPVLTSTFERGSRDSQFHISKLLENVFDLLLENLYKYLKEYDDEEQKQDSSNIEGNTIRTFLIRLQVCLFSRAVEQKSGDSDAYDRYAMSYALKVCDECEKIIAFCVDDYKRNITHPRLSLAKLSEVLHDRLGVILSPIMNSLWAMKLDVVQASEMLPVLHKLLLASDNLGSIMPDVMIEEQLFLKGTQQKLLTERTEIAQALNPPQGTTEQTITIPGANELILEIDPNTFSARGAASGVSLKLYREKGQSKPIEGGTFTSLPGSPVHVDGDTVTIAFNSGYQTNVWGFKVTARAHIEEVSVEIPWTLDLVKSVGLVAGKCAGVLVRGHIDEQQKESQRLASQFFSEGLEYTNEQDEDEQKILDWLPRHLNPTSSKQFNIEDQEPIEYDVDRVMNCVDRLIPILKAYVRLPPFPIPKAVTKTIDTAIRHVVGVLLKHNLLIDEAEGLCDRVTEEQEQSGGSDQPAVDVGDFLSRVWRTAHKLRSWILQKVQKKRGTGEDDQVDRNKIYFETCFDVIDRCNFLLRLVPVLSKTTRGAPSQASLGKKLSLVRTRSDPQNIEMTDEQKVARSTLLAWQSTKEATPLLEANQDERFSLIWRIVLDFLSDETIHVGSLEPTIVSQRQRARQRSIGLLAFRDLIVTTSFSSVKREIIHSFVPSLDWSSTAVMSGVKNGIAPGIRFGVKCAGMRLTELVRKSFGELYESFIAILQNPSKSGSNLIQAVLHAFHLDYSDEDFHLILSLQIFPALQKILLSEEEKSNRDNIVGSDGNKNAAQISAWALLDLLTTRILNEKAKGSVNGFHDISANVEPVFEILVNQLKKMAQQLEMENEREKEPDKYTPQIPATTLKGKSQNEARDADQQSAQTTKVSTVSAFGVSTTQASLESSLHSNMRSAGVNYRKGDDPSVFVDAFSVKVLNMIDKIGFLDSGFLRAQGLAPLLKILRLGSPRSKVVVMRILRRLLCGSSAPALGSVDEKIHETGQVGAVDGQASVEFFLAQIGQALIGPAFASLAANEEAVKNHDVKHVLHRLNISNIHSTDSVASWAEGIMLVRFLADSSQEWRTIVTQTISSAVSKLPEVLDELIRTKDESLEESLAVNTKLWDTTFLCLGAICICGGYVDTLRVGARVQFVMEDAKGVIVSRNPSNETVNVIRDEEGTVVEVKSEEVLTIGDISFHQTNLTSENGAELLTVFAQALHKHRTDSAKNISIGTVKIEIQPESKSQSTLNSSSAARQKEIRPPMSELALGTLISHSYRSLYFLLLESKAVSHLVTNQASGDSSIIKSLFSATGVPQDETSTASLEDKMFCLTNESTRRAHGTSAIVVSLRHTRHGPEVAVQKNKTIFGGEYTSVGNSIPGSSETQIGHHPRLQVNGNLVYVLLGEELKKENVEGKIVMIDTYGDFIPRIAEAAKCGATALVLGLHTASTKSEGLDANNKKAKKKAQGPDVIAQAQQRALLEAQQLAQTSNAALTYTQQYQTPPRQQQFNDFTFRQDDYSLPPQQQQGLFNDELMFDDDGFEEEWDDNVGRPSRRNVEIFPSLPMNSEDAKNVFEEKMERRDIKDVAAEEAALIKALPVIAVPSSTTTVLRMLLGVRRDYNPEIIHQEMLQDQLVELGYAREHTLRALQKTEFDVKKAAKWLDDNREWLHADEILVELGLENISKQSDPMDFLSNKTGWDLFETWNEFKRDVFGFEHTADALISQTQTAQWAGSLALLSTPALLTEVMETHSSLVTHYARRALVNVFTHWPKTKSLTALGNPDSLTTALHIALTLDNHQAGELEPEKHLSKRDFTHRLLVSLIVDRERTKSDISNIPSEQRTLDSCGIRWLVPQVQPLLFSSDSDKNVEGKDPDITREEIQSNHSFLAHTMEGDCIRLFSELVGSAIRPDPEKQSSKGSLKKVKAEVKNRYMSAAQIDQQRRNGSLPNQHQQRVEVKGARSLRITISCDDLAQYGNVYVTFYGDEAISDLLHQAILQNNQHGDNPEPTILISDREEFWYTVSSPNWYENNQMTAHVTLEIRDLAHRRITDREMLEGNIETALTFIDALLRTKDGAVHRLLELLLKCLPFIQNRKTAQQCCRTAARIFNHWKLVDSGGNGEVVGAYVEKLERAHAKLRSQILGDWNRRGLPPPHLQTLLELVMAARRAFPQEMDEKCGLEGVIPKKGKPKTTWDKTNPFAPPKLFATDGKKGKGDKSDESKLESSDETAEATGGENLTDQPLSQTTTIIQPMQTGGFNFSSTPTFQNNTSALRAIQDNTSAIRAIQDNSSAIRFGNFGGGSVFGGPTNSSYSADPFAPIQPAFVNPHFQQGQVPMQLHQQPPPQGAFFGHGQQIAAPSPETEAPTSNSQREKPKRDKSGSKSKDTPAESKSDGKRKNGKKKNKPPTDEERIAQKKLDFEQGLKSKPPTGSDDSKETTPDETKADGAKPEQTKPDDAKPQSDSELPPLQSGETTPTSFSSVPDPGLWDFGATAAQLESQRFTVQGRRRLGTGSPPAQQIPMANTQQGFSFGGGNVFEPETPTGDMVDGYRLYRDGEPMVNLVSLRKKTILKDRVVHSSTNAGFQKNRYKGSYWGSSNRGYEHIVGDVILRKGGKWYWEVTVNTSPTQFSIGWITRDYVYYPANLLNQDRTGDTWSMTLPQVNYYYRGRSCVPQPKQPGSKYKFSVGSSTSGVGSQGAADRSDLFGDIDDYYPASSYQSQSIHYPCTVGVMLDLDNQEMAFSINGNCDGVAFSGFDPSKGLYPAFVLQASVNVNVEVNYGRKVFKHKPFGGYMPLEHPQIIASSWLSRYRHASDVTNLLYHRKPLPESVVQSALDQELTMDVSADLRFEVVQADGQPSAGNLAATNCLTNDQTYFHSRKSKNMHITFKATSNLDFFLRAVHISCTNAGFFGMIFVSQTKPELESFEWCDNFKKNHYTRFIARKDARKETLRAHEPVAYFTCSATYTNVHLKPARRARYITIKISSSNPSSNQGIYIENVKFSCVHGEHPLGPIIGTDEAVQKVDQIVKGLHVAASNWSSDWSLAMDEALVAMVQAQCTRLGVGMEPSSLDAIMLNPSDEDLMRFKSLAHVSLDGLRSRFALIKYLNRLVTPLLYYIDISVYDDESALIEQRERIHEDLLRVLKERSEAQSTDDDLKEIPEAEAESLEAAFGLLELNDGKSLSYVVQKLKGCYFMSTKKSVLDTLLDDSPSSLQGRTSPQNQQPKLTVNRIRAAQAKESKATGNDTDPYGLKSVFGQLFSQLRNVRYDTFKAGKKDQQLFTVAFAGEGSIDVGGPYRESITNSCADLMSNATPLFIKCPNGVNDVGLNREKFIPNPACTDSTHLAMFEFVGVLMGIALRTKMQLGLDLPSMVWRGLLNEKVDSTDLEGIDKLCVQALDELTKLDKNKFDEMVTETFQTQLSNGVQVELKEGGSEVPVTADVRKEFVELVISTRLQESTSQTRAIQKGLDQVVPIRMLRLFSWYDLEVLVCGNPVIDIEILRRHTRYSGLHQNHPVTKFLWQALESYNMEARQMFLRFVWGRNRLPAEEADWGTTQFTLNSLNATDESLPIAHTCFFSLDLPNYSSYEVLRDKVLFAIFNCQAIDVDFNPSSSSLNAWVDE